MVSTLNHAKLGLAPSQDPYFASQPDNLVTAATRGAEAYTVTHVDALTRHLPRVSSV